MQSASLGSRRDDLITRQSPECPPQARACGFGGGGRVRPVLDGHGPAGAREPGAGGGGLARRGARAAAARLPGGVRVGLVRDGPLDGLRAGGGSRAPRGAGRPRHPPCPAGGAGRRGRAGGGPRAACHARGAGRVRGFPLRPVAGVAPPARDALGPPGSRGGHGVRPAHADRGPRLRPRVRLPQHHRSAPRDLDRAGRASGRPRSRMGGTPRVRGDGRDGGGDSGDPCLHGDRPCGGPRARDHGRRGGGPRAVGCVPARQDR